MTTSATFLKTRSTAERPAYEITSTAEDDTEVTLPNVFGTTAILVQIEPAQLGNGRQLPPDYLASNWRISDDTTKEVVVLRKDPAPGSGAKDPQAVAFVSAQVPAVPAPAKAPAAKAKPKAKK